MPNSRTNSKPNRARERAARRLSNAAKIGMAPGALVHAERKPSTLMRINFATTQEAAFWKTFARVRDEQAR